MKNSFLSILLLLSFNLRAETYNLLEDTFTIEVEAVKFVVEAVPGVLDDSNGLQVSGEVKVSDLDSLSGLDGFLEIINPAFDTGVSERDEAIHQALGKKIKITIRGGQYDQEARIFITDAEIEINDIKQRQAIKVRIIPGSYNGKDAVGVKGVAVIKRSDFDIQLGFFGSVGDENIRDEVVVLFGAVFVR